MKEERMLILSMLQEGKISAEEAASLLGTLGASRDLEDEFGAEAGGDGTADFGRDGRAIRDGHGSRDDGASRDGGMQVDVGAMWDDALHWVGKARDRFEAALERTRKRMDDAGEKAADAGATASKEAGDFLADLERGFSKVATELPDAVSRLMRFEFGPAAYKEVAWHYEGGFGDASGAGTVLDAAEPLRITVFTGDGNVKLESTDGDEYRVDLVNKVRFADEEEAAVIAKEATRWEAFEDGFRLSAGQGRDVRADVVIKLPREGTYVLDVQTADGNVAIDGVTFAEARINSADGNIRLEDVVGDTVSLTTADGGVRIHGDVGTLSALTSDGSIRATYSGRTDAAPRERLHWDLRTSDGGIRIELPTKEDIGYEFDLSAADGTVRVQLPEIEQAALGTDRRGVHVFTPGFSEKAAQFTVRARTADGSVSVRSVVEEGS